MINIALIIKHFLTESPSDYSTHYNDCYLNHEGCAIAVLCNEVLLLREELETYKQEILSSHQEESKLRKQLSSTVKEKYR